MKRNVNCECNLVVKCIHCSCKFLAIEALKRSERDNSNVLRCPKCKGSMGKIS